VCTVVHSRRHTINLYEKFTYIGEIPKTFVYKSSGDHFSKNDLAYGDNTEGILFIVARRD
jgi:hypothetical protein